MIRPAYDSRDIKSFEHYISNLCTARKRVAWDMLFDLLGYGTLVSKLGVAGSNYSIQTGVEVAVAR